MVYLKNILFILSLFFVFNIQGQQLLSNNFVQNPSFEEYDTCPFSSGQLNLSKYWWGFSTEYYNACAIPTSFSVPSNYNGFQYAHTGVAYVGFLLYWHSSAMINNETYVETIKNILNDSLKKNSRYCVNYYVSVAEGTFQWATALNSLIFYDSIGTMFTVNQVQNDVNTILCDTCTKFAKSIANIDTTNWLKISGSVIANGGEKYLSIGKFSTMNWTPNVYTQFYIYVDDVSVCECSFKFSLGNDTTLCNGETLQLNVNMPNAIYTWQDGSTDSIYTVTHAGTYWVRAYFPDYNITTYDTINVMYKDCDTIDTNDNIISIYPNPATDNLTIETNFKEEHRLEIINLLGQAIYTTYIGRKSMINTSNYASGLYFLKIYTDKEIVVRKFVKE